MIDNYLNKTGRTFMCVNSKLGFKKGHLYKEYVSANSTKFLRSESKHILSSSNK